MDTASYAGDGNLRLTFATWVAALHALGVAPEDDTIGKHCDDLANGDQEAAARCLVDALADRLKDAAPLEVARSLFGDRVKTDLGEGNRGDRLSRIRKYQFGRQLPWLARIWERGEDGAVAPSWLLVEMVTDEVRTMDFNPWNDIDEERCLPVADFQVLWELDGCTAIAIS